MMMSRWILLRRRYVSDKSCRETQNTHFVFNNPPPENRAVYGIMWEKILEQGRPQMEIWGMHLACRVAKATNSHSENVILIVFLRQQWLRERASLLPYSTLLVLLFLLHIQVLIVAIMHDPSCGVARIRQGCC